MISQTLNRRQLLGTTAAGVTALALMPGAALSGISGPAGTACGVNHVELSRNLAALVNDPDVGPGEKAMALKTCSCLHCGVGIMPVG